MGLLKLLILFLILYLSDNVFVSLESYMFFFFFITCQKDPTIWTPQFFNTYIL